MNERTKEVKKGYLIAVYSNNEEVIYTDNMFNIINMCKDYDIKDIINYKGYIKKDYKVIMGAEL